MSFLRLFVRVLALLSPVIASAVALALANIALAFTQFAEPMLFGKVVDQLARGVKSWGGIAPWLAAWAGFALFSIVAGVLVSLYADRLAHRRRLAAMADYFEHVMALPALYHAETHTGRLLEVMIEGSNAMFTLWLSFFREHCASFVALFVMLPMTLIVNARLGGILVALVIVFAIAINFVIRRTASMQGAATQVAADLAERVSDALGNLPAIQSFGRVDSEAEAFRALSGRLIRQQFPVLAWWAVASVATRASSTLSLLAIFVTGVWLDIRGETTVGEVVAFMSLATGLIGRLEQIVGFVNFLFGRAPKIGQFFEVIDLAPDVADRPGAFPAGRLAGKVRFEDVGFSYGAGKTALAGLSLSARAGQTIAIVGATGSGKSTAMALLYRAFDPSEGRVTIDGHDIRDFTLASLRENIGVVFQEPFLLARSIEENLRLGKPDASAAEIQRALEAAQAADFVARQPQGLASPIGERGRTLSGGERQRLSIARALLKDPPILLLDEATSALDAETETKLQKAVESARRGRTTFVIAHRLATIRSADLILVLSGGRIVESGTFATLTAQGGVFAKLAAAQFVATASGNADASARE